MNCNYKIELNGEIYEFKSTDGLNSFIRNNKNRLELYYSQQKAGINKKVKTTPNDRIQTNKIDKDPTLSQRIFDGKERLSIKEVLENIASRSDNKIYSDFAKILLQKNIDFTYPVILEKNWDALASISNADNANGLYTIGDNHIYINSNGNFRKGNGESTIIHEILHYITDNHIDKNSRQFKDIQKIFDHANKLGINKYGLTSIDEFISDIFVKGDLISELSKQKPLVGIIKGNSLLDQFVNSILSFLGIDENNNLYTQASTLIMDLIVNKDNINFDNDHKPVITSTVEEGFEQEVYEEVKGNKKGMVFNAEQNEAIKKAADFVRNGDPSKWFVIEGAAGTGKTTIAEQIARQFPDKSIYVAALSNKATEVISNKFADADISFAAMSIAALLGKKMDEDTGTFKDDQNYANKPPVTYADIIIVDEASMVNEEALQLIMDKKNKSTKVVFLGDVAQLPPIRTVESFDSYYKGKEKFFGKDSPVFDVDDKYKSTLTERVRQGEESPILPFADYFSKNSKSTNPVNNPAAKNVRQNVINDKGALIFANSIQNILPGVENAFKNAVNDKDPNHIKIVTYQNNRKDDLNRIIRNGVFGSNASTMFNKGELLMLYSPYGDLLKNSSEVVLDEIDQNIKIDNNGIRYHESTVIYRNTPIQIPLLRFEDRAKYEALVKSKFAYAKTLKYGDKTTYRNALDDAWATARLYPDVRYGYAITSHKAQGSTYDIVIIDEQDIDRTQALTAKSKSQSIYTALTRSRNVVVSLSPYPAENISVDVEELNNSISKSRKKPVTQEVKNEKVYKGKMTFNYGQYARPGVLSKTTFDAIKNGERTATTRFESDGNIDYWKKVKVGDIIEFANSKGDIVKVRVTKPLHKLAGSGKTANVWSNLEGWSVDFFNKQVLPKINEAWQIEYTPIEDSQLMIRNKGVMSKYSDHSGGASQSDTDWDEIGRTFGMTEIYHYREPDAKEVDSNELKKNGIKPTNISDAVYAEGIEKATRAARQMYGLDGNITSNYIIRNWAQVKNSDGIFAIGTIIKPGESLSEKSGDNRTALIQQVKGGTGYAVQMAINENKKVFVFNDPEKRWYKYDYDLNQFIPSDVPVLTKRFAGIGTRNQVNREDCLQAIRDVYEKTLKFDGKINFTKNNNLIKFSKAYSKLEEAAAVLQKEIDRSDLLTKGNTTSASGYTGVNTKIKDYRDGGKRIVAEMIKDNYITNYVNQNYEKQKEDARFIGKNEAQIKNVLKTEAETNIKNWGMITDFGTDIHRAAEYFFNTPNPNIQEVKALLKYGIPSEALDSLFNSLDKLKAYFTIRYGTDFKTFTEVKIHDDSSKVVGVLDLVILDKNGKAHIVDYKASYKNMSDWSSAKDLSIRYQMAIYRQLLRNTGIDVESISIMPVKINDIDFDTKTFSSLSFDSHIELLGDITSNKYQTVANDIVPISKIIFETSADISNEIRNTMKNLFGYDVKSRMTNKSVDWFKKNKILTEESTGKKYFIDYETKGSGKVTQVYVTDADIDEKIKAYFEKQQQNQGSLVKSMRNFIISCQNEVADINAKYKANQTRSFDISNIFGRYATNDWEVIENEESDALGIMMFRNKKTNIVDIVSVTTNKISEPIKLAMGTTILGNHISDTIAKRDTRILPATNGSIEFMKIATFLNVNQDSFTNKGMSIGTIRIFNENSHEANGITFEDLKYNFGRLSKETGNISNLSKIDKANPYDLLLARLDYLTNNFMEERSKSFFSKKLESLQNNILTQDKINDLVELQNELLRTIARSNSVYSEYNDLLNMVSSALLFYKNLDVRYELDIKTWALNNSKMLTNPFSFSSKHKNIQQVIKLNETAMYNIRSKFIDYKETTRDNISSFMEASGYSKLREYAIGDNVAAYDKLFRIDPTTGQKDSRLLIKDPSDPKNGLNAEQRKFAQFFLDNVNRNKYKTQEEIDEAKADLSYYAIPLIKGSTYTRLRGKSYKNVVKDYWKDMFNFNSFFEEDMEISRKKSDEMIELFNQFQNQNRERLLLENNPGDFETDLELVMDTVVMSSIRKSEFDQVLPYINAIRVVVDFQAKGILSDQKETLDYTKKYIRNSTYNDKMVDDNLETMAKFASVLKDMTSTLTLGFNVMSGVREFLQGQFGNITKMASTYYGKDAFTADDYRRATGVMLDDTHTFFHSLTMIEELNNVYGMSNMDINNIVQKVSSSNKGVLAFRSRWGFWMNSGPEYFNRMTLFLAQMMKDGTYDAHEVKGGKLVYDMKKDGRFKNYISNNTASPKYQEEKGLYIAMLNAFNEMGHNLKEGDMLPSAYTVEQRNSYKSFSDIIYGSYDHESKVMFENTVLGMMMMQFKKWIFAKKDQYFLQGGEYCRGSFEHKEDENGNKLYYNALGELSTDTNGTPLMEWKGRYMEGILWSLKGLYKDVIDNKGNLSLVYKNMKENTPERISNIKAAMLDMSVFMALAIIGGCVDWGELKKDKSYMSAFYKTVLNSGNDLYIGNNIETIINSKNPIPVITYGINFKTSIAKTLSGDQNVFKILTSNVGVFRPFDAMID